MSHLPPSPLQVQFYLAAEAPCPYLPNQKERKLFTLLPNDPPIDTDINSTLTLSGFRRSHDVVYRPACAACNACVPVRIPVHDFTANRTQRRIARMNKDMQWGIAPNHAHAEDYELFAAYQRARHSDGEMANMSWRDYRTMIESSATDSFLYRMHTSSGQLTAVIFCDRVAQGFSAVYSFYSPDSPERSLGTYCILSLIEAARQNNTPYVYLGYWIAKSQKMSYKSNFHPLEALTPHGWKPVEQF